MRSISTYEELLQEGKRYLGVKSAYSYESALKAFREFVGDALTDAIDPRVRHFDEPALLAAFQQMGLPLEQARSKRSMVKRWSQALEVAELFGGRELGLPEKLRLLLERRDLSQRELARRVHVDETTVRRWMQGEGWRSLGPAKIYELEKALKVPVATLGGAKPKKRARAAGGRRSNGRAVPPPPEQDSVQAQESHDLQMASGSQRAARDVPSNRGGNGGAASLPARHLVYRLHWEQWPARLKDEWARLEAYKRPSAVATFEGENDGGWRKDGTVKIYRGETESLAGFALQGTDVDGLGLSAEALSLALMVDPDVVRKWAEFRAMQVGRYTVGVEKVVHFATMLLRPETGWIWRNPDVAAALDADRLRGLARGLGVTVSAQVPTREEWQLLCVASREKLKGLVKMIRKRVMMLRDPVERIGPIVRLHEPLAVIDQMHQMARRDLDQYRGQTYNLRYAQYMASRLLRETVLRVEQFSRLTYREDNSGYLRRNADGQWHILMPVWEYKNYYSSRFANATDRLMEYELPDYVQEEITYYLEVVRPALLDGEAHDRVFVTMHGTPASGDRIHVWIKKLTGLYLAGDSDRGLQMQDVTAFGPHAYRTIFASHAATNGWLEKAAHALGDTWRTVSRQYSRGHPGVALKDAFRLSREY